MSIANACARLQIVCAVLRATGQALVDLLINGAAVVTLPAGFACAHLGLKQMRFWLNCTKKTEVDSKSRAKSDRRLTVTLAGNACSMSRARWIQAISCKIERGMEKLIKIWKFVLDTNLRRATTTYKIKAK